MNGRITTLRAASRRRGEMCRRSSGQSQGVAELCLLQQQLTVCGFRDYRGRRHATEGIVAVTA